MSIDVPNLILNLGISFLSALAGAYAGTRAATYWQQKRENQRFESDKEATILKAVILCRHYAQVISKIEDKITINDRDLEWFEVNVIGISISPSLEQDIPALLTYLGRMKSQYFLFQVVATKNTGNYKSFLLRRTPRKKSPKIMPSHLLAMHGQRSWNL